MDSITLQTSDSGLTANEILGRIAFAASNEASGGDSVKVSALISAVAESEFTSISNHTSLIFATATDDTATNKLKISPSGHFVPLASGEYDLGSGLYPFRKLFTDNLRVADYNFPTSDGTSGHVLSTDGQGQLSFVSVASAGDNYVDSVSFDPSNNKLTLGRTGSLIDLFTTISFTDTNTTYTAGSGLFLDSSNEFHANVSGIQSVASNSTTSTASRTYAIQIDPNDQLVVNVPWVDTDTDTDTDTNDHLDDVVWNDTTGDLTFSFTGPSSLSNIVENLDGRYHHIITNPVSGVGSADYVARWLDVSTLGTGILYDDGSKVGIGMEPDSIPNLPAAGNSIPRLSVEGEVAISGTRPLILNGGTHGIRKKGDPGGWAFSWDAVGASGTVYPGFGFYGSDDALLRYWIGNSYLTPDISIDPAGTVGIGYTPVSYARLRVWNDNNGPGYSQIIGGYNNGTACLINASTATDNATVNGFYSYTYPTNNAEVSNYYHFRATPPHDTTGKITNQHGFYANLLKESGINPNINTVNYSYISQTPSGIQNQNWAFYAGGTARNYFSSQVGIGTTYTANAKLTVSDGANTRIAIDTGANYGSSEVGIDFIDRHNATGQGIEGQNTAFIRTQRQGDGGSFDLTFGTVHGSVLSADADEKVRITSEGRVGIGTDDPVTDLHVYNSGHNPSNAKLIVDNDSVVTKLQSYSNLGYVGTESNHDFFIRSYNADRVSVTNDKIIINPNEDAYDFEVRANNSVNPLIYADADSGTYGRLGIGRTPGNHVVDVSGSMRINPLPAATITATINRNSNAPTIKSEGNTNANKWMIIDSAGMACALNYFSTDNVVLCYGGNAGGFVGIGTTNPAYKLDVNGATRSTNGYYLDSTSALLLANTNSDMRLLKFAAGNVEILAGLSDRNVLITNNYNTSSSSPSVVHINPDETFADFIHTSENGNDLIYSDSSTDTVDIYKLSINQGTYTFPTTTGNAGDRLVYAGGSQVVWSGVQPDLSGAGSANYVTRWTSSNTLGTGILYDDGSNVGIDNSSPASKLTINDDILYGTTAISDHGISVNMNGNDRPAFTTTSDDGETAFSILPWVGNVYLSAGVVYNNSSWRRLNNTDNVNMMVMQPAVGARWYAADTNGITGDTITSWNQSSAELLWDNYGSWRNNVRYTGAEGSYFYGALGVGRAAQSNIMLDVEKYNTWTSTSFPTSRNIYSATHNTVSSNCQQFSLGINATNWKTVASGVTDTGYVMGGDFSGLANGSGILSSAYGARTYGGIHTGGTGTVTDAYGVRSRVLNLGTGDATITNGFGLYIDSVQATNGYGIYQTGTGDTNYFKGDIGVGFNTPSENLETANSIGILNGWKIYQGTVNISGGGTANGASVILNNEHLATLNTAWHYIVRLNTTGTGVDTGSSYLVWYSQDTTTWIARMISRSGDFSNHPLLYINSSNAVIYNNHAGAYDVNYVVESYFAGVDDATAHSMGADFHWQRDVDDLSYSDGTVTASDFIGENYIDKHSAVNLSVGWYTVATNMGSGQNGRATARFGLANEAGGRHQGIVFYASHHYGAGNKINILHNDCYNVNNKPISKIRIKEGGTYDGCLLQIYIDDSTNQVQVKLLDDNINKLLGNADAGWKVVDWVADATDPGTVANFSNLTNVSTEINLDDFDFGSTGDVHGKSFVKSGGASSEFLKADGSVDTSTYLTSFTETNDLSTAVWANVPDANITQGSVTQHQAALSITESQISDLQSYLTSVTLSDIAAAAIVTEAEGISSNDNDTTLPTSAAVKDYVDSNTGGGGNNVVRGTVSATNGQTSFSVGGGYTVGAIDVYLNGVKLINGTDFTATDTSAPYNIVLTSAAQSGDTLEYVAFDRATTAGTLQDTGDTMTGNLTVNADLIVTGYKETHTDNGNTGTAQTIDISDSTIQTYTLTGNCTFTMPTAEAGRSFTMFLKTGAGSFVATFTNVKFPKDTAPTVTTDANRMDLIVFTSDGTNWYGNATQEYHV